MARPLTSLCCSSSWACLAQRCSAALKRSGSLPGPCLEATCQLLRHRGRMEQPRGSVDSALKEEESSGSVCSDKRARPATAW